MADKECGATVLTVLKTIIASGNLFTQCIAIYLIFYIVKTRGRSLHLMCLLNLSTTQLFMAFGYVIKRIGAKSFFSHDKHKYIIYMFILDNILFKTVFYLTILFIIINKALEMTFGTRYTVWSESKTRLLTIVFWLSGLSLCTAVMGNAITYLKKFNTVFLQYYHTPVAITSLLVTTLSYIIIFYKLNASRILPPYNNLEINIKRRVPGFWKVLKKSQIYPTFLYTTFFMAFDVLPQLVKGVYLLQTGKLIKQHSFLLFDLMMLFISLACICYETRVKRILKKVMDIKKCERDIERAYRLRHQYPNWKTSQN